MTMPDALDWLDDALADLDRRGLRRTLSARSAVASGPYIEINGQKLVNFGSNDYLGLAADPRVAAAASAAIEQYGWGSGASPLVTGRTELHAELEKKLAEFEGTEAALLFPSGYAANVGTITALVGKGDAIYSDELNHASIIDGCRLSGATVHVYRHCDVDHVEDLLRFSDVFRRHLIVTDSLFSLHGDLAPMNALRQLAERYGAMFLQDKSHCTGVLPIHKRASVFIGTLSKAVGGSGGYAAGSQRLIDWLANRARPYVFSTAAPPAAAAAGLAALQIMKDEPERHRRLLQYVRHMYQLFKSHDLTRTQSFSQIIPIILGDAATTMSAAAELRRRGFFVPAIRPPSVPEGQSLLRISLTAMHTEEQIDALVAAVADVAR
jgi:8-amino-7-oxononanoate synthase